MYNLDELFQMILKGRQSKYFDKNIDLPKFGYDYYDDEKLSIKNSLYQMLEKEIENSKDRIDTVKSILKILSKYERIFSLDEIEILSDTALMECYKFQKDLSTENISDLKENQQKIIETLEIKKYIKFIEQSKNMVGPARELRDLENSKRERRINGLSIKTKNQKLKHILNLLNKEHTIKSLELKKLLYNRSIEEVYANLNILRRKLQLGNNTTDRINNYIKLTDYFKKIEKSAGINELYLRKYNHEITDKQFKKALEQVNKEDKMSDLTKLIYDEVTSFSNNLSETFILNINTYKDYTNLEKELTSKLDNFLRKDLYFCIPNIIEPSINDMSVCLKMVQKLDKIINLINNKDLRRILFNIQETILSKEAIQIDNVRRSYNINNEHSLYIDEVHSNNEQIIKLYMKYFENKRYCMIDSLSKEERNKALIELSNTKALLDSYQNKEFTYQDNKVKKL